MMRFCSHLQKFTEVCRQQLEMPYWFVEKGFQT